VTSARSSRDLVPASRDNAKVTGETEVRNAERLEQLWAGDFGDAYTERNRGAVDRKEFWRGLIDSHPFADALEVGCNVGDNLLALSGLLSPLALAGVDVNAAALAIARAALPEADLQHVPARELPFPDGAFELVFTAMVLIHQPDETLGAVMEEIVRCSNRYVLSIEYESTERVDVPYREQEGALFKRPYGQLYAATFPQLRPVADGFLGQAEGWDDVTWWLFEQQPIPAPGA
jgi:pseudaminic acid biosynthesis-associated methylase